MTEKDPDDALIKKVIAAVEGTLASMVIDNYMVALNGLTEIIVKTLKTNERLSRREAYRRASEVFADAAVAEADAEAKRRLAVRCLSPQIKFKQYQIRQQRVARRAEKRRATT